MEVYIQGEISESVVEMFYNTVKECEDSVKINITSYGGYAECGLAIVDIIEDLKRKGVQVHTNCIGITASSASVIFFAGNKRTMTENSRIVLHQVRSGEISNTSLDSLKTESKIISDLNKRFLQIYNKVLKKYKFHSYDDVFYKKDCLKLNIITDENY